MGAIDKCSIPFPLLSGGSYYVHVPMEGLPFLLQISAPSVAPGLFCCCKTSSSFTINRLFKSADIEGGLVFTYKESMLYVKRSGVYFNIIPLHSGYIFKQGTGDIPNDAIELTIQWIVDNMLLGELLGNPKGTKSFSSWSEFTDFVNEMPIKTIQPFVSNFNAFAGEGFYGNVVQGLVIKQLEDAVFIFGIAIDGTLIFRKRNYPDVSTWEDPKIIIHSNNWHKIYFVTDLGELIGTATANKNGLMSKIFAVTDIERGKGLIIDYKADSNGLYTSSSLIEIYVYSGANTAFYRVMSIPTGSKNIEIKYMGMHWCDFKYANSKLYVLPKSDDSSISYKVSLVRRTRPNFLTIDFSDFSNITGEIITPTPD